MKTTMAIDQYGQTYHDLGKHPRKALCERLGRKHASKMYRDCIDGTVQHVGYVIGTLWLTVMAVDAWKSKATGTAAS